MINSLLLRLKRRGRITSNILGLIKRLLPIIIVLLYCLVPLLARGQDFDQLTRPVASLVRPSQIDTFLAELLIPPPDSVSRLEVVDITGNGYGPDDMVIVYPAQRVYPISADVPRLLQDIMKTWELEADYRLDATLANSEGIERDAHRHQDPRGAITGAVVNAIAEYYDGKAMDLRLSRGEEGLRLEMWNYDPNALRYRPQQADLSCANAATQRFAFARPRFVMAFNEPGACLEAHQTNGQISMLPCTQ